MYDGESLKHTKWECKYHLVFIPKYRKKVWYGALRHQLGGLLRELARQRESQVEEGHLLRDHVHMLMSIPPKYSGPSGGIPEREECHLHCSDLHGEAEKLHG